jgi:hypothetical protein
VLEAGRVPVVRLPNLVDHRHVITSLLLGK